MTRGTLWNTIIITPLYPSVRRKILIATCRRTVGAPAWKDSPLPAIRTHDGWTPRIFRYWRVNIWRRLMPVESGAKKAAEASPWRPYGRQTIDDDDIAAVVSALRSDWLTTGPEIPKFEEEFAAITGARYAVAVNSGTAALHAAVNACDIGPGDEVLVPSLTFAATAN